MRLDYYAGGENVENPRDHVAQIIASKILIQSIDPYWRAAWARTMSAVASEGSPRRLLTRSISKSKGASSHRAVNGTPASIAHCFIFLRSASRSKTASTITV